MQVLSIKPVLAVTLSQAASFGLNGARILKGKRASEFSSVLDSTGEHTHSVQRRHGCSAAVAQGVLKTKYLMTF